MTLEQAFQKLLSDPNYQEISKQRDSLGARYRIYAARFKRGELKAGALTEMLIAHGWVISARQATPPAKK